GLHRDLLPRRTAKRAHTRCRCRDAPTSATKSSPTGSQPTVVAHRRSIERAVFRSGQRYIRPSAAAAKQFSERLPESTSDLVPGAGSALLAQAGHGRGYGDITPRMFHTCFRSSTKAHRSDLKTSPNCYFAN